MSMAKIISPGLHPELLMQAQRPAVQLIESLGHIKSASADPKVRSILEDLKPDKDHFLAHSIATGDYNRYGFNKNADAFTKEANAMYHDTFVKYGAYYEEHRHDSKDKAIGVIKSSMYNEPQGRTEVFYWGHKKKAARAYEKLKSGKPMMVSMSCRVPYDRCSITGHKAKTRDEYSFYCRNFFGQYVPSVEKYAFVFNDHPVFFDISDVDDPAAIMAATLNTISDEGMKKAASAGSVLPSSLLVERGGIYVPEIPGAGSLRKRGLLTKMAKAEELVRQIQSGHRAEDGLSRFYKYAAANIFEQGRNISESELKVLKSIPTGVLMRKLASRSIMLPFPSFYAWAFDTTIADALSSPVVKYAMIKHIPEVFTQMLDEEDILPQIEPVFEPDPAELDQYVCGYEDPVDEVLDDIHESFSLEPEAVQGRTVTIVMKKEASAPAVEPEVTAEQEYESRFASMCYGMYKLASLDQFRDNMVDTTTFLAIIRQNISN